MKLHKPFGALLLVAILTPITLANAESVDSDHQSVNIAPAASGPVVAQGNAGFDTSGISAAASATAPKTGAGQNLSSGLTFTYTPIPDNTLVTVGPPQANNR